MARNRQPRSSYQKKNKEHSSPVKIQWKDTQKEQSSSPPRGLLYKLSISLIASAEIAVLVYGASNKFSLCQAGANNIIIIQSSSGHQKLESSAQNFGQKSRQEAQTHKPGFKFEA